MNQYELYARIGGRWEFLCRIDAAGHPEAFRQAMLCLKPEHYDKEIRLEQVKKKEGAGDGASCNPGI